jgi:diaminopimelate epimerase
MKIDFSYSNIQSRCKTNLQEVNFCNIIIHSKFCNFVTCHRKVTNCQSNEIMTSFYKFHGTGNDFIMFDGINHTVRISSEKIAELCHRQFGIGADGLIILNSKSGFDFEMVYFNADGSAATMCGNGARCAAAFASLLGITGSQAVFSAGDGPHTSTIRKINENEWMVEISMRDVDIPSEYGKVTEINTGTPHLVKIVSEVSEIDTFTEGRKIRFSDKYKESGINVDWLGIDNKLLKVRTYERGVENETLSCGTGVTACAMVAALTTGKTSWEIDTPGGRLSVSLKKEENCFSEVKLKGPAKMVYKGEINLPEI